MKAMVQILNFIVALCCILIVAGMFWFLYLVFVQGYGGYSAIMFLVHRFLSGWNAFWGWLGTLLP